jgi:hypothetical protein
VVLNKIDTLWDELRTPAQIEAEIARQCASTAQTLEVDARQVMALSAQKGLLAKVRGDAALLQLSRLPSFEALLARMVLGERQQALERAVGHGLERLQADALRVIGVQRREWVEQVQELKGLRGKNHAVIRHMRRRVEREAGLRSQRRRRAGGAFGARQAAARGVCPAGQRQHQAGAGRPERGLA